MGGEAPDLVTPQWMIEHSDDLGTPRSWNHYAVGWAHAIDVAPTVLEAAGLPFPTMVNGVLQEPLHGVGMNYSFDDPAAAERHET